ncbi:hypothetical protein HPB50_013667 [Hyalomma asiaticum]|uniref:Uncharacterized protein n=1 Tax=Hyalomma asiaticum TaxID=266040 RepID=A0ACB7TJY4_HYAAI|nr:hypothetical protein HPB50_013667 [Hyalomma asiaticum]
MTDSMDSGKTPFSINIVYMQEDGSGNRFPPEKPKTTPTASTTTWQQQAVGDSEENRSTEDSSSPIAAQLNNVRLKLEERRRKIEQDKRRMKERVKRQQQKVRKGLASRCSRREKSPLRWWQHPRINWRHPHRGSLCRQLLLGASSADVAAAEWLPTTRGEKKNPQSDKKKTDRANPLVDPGCMVYACGQNEFSYQPSSHQNGIAGTMQQVSYASFATPSQQQPQQPLQQQQQHPLPPPFQVPCTVSTEQATAATRAQPEYQRLCRAPPAPAAEEQLLERLKNLSKGSTASQPRRVEFGKMYRVSKSQQPARN